MSKIFAVVRNINNDIVHYYYNDTQISWGGTWGNLLNYTTYEIPSHMDPATVIFNGVSFVIDPIKENEKSINDWIVARKIRNNLLLETDFIEFTTVPISAALRSSFDTYRQDLRDIPQTYSAVKDIVWPIQPTYVKNV